MPPPSTQREPSARSAPASQVAIRRGTSFGSWEKSQSISSTSSAPAASACWKPARYALPEPLLRRTVQDLDPGQLRREPVGDLARPVGRVVVDHEDAVARGVELLAEGAHHRLEVLPLVVRRQADHRAHRPILPVPAAPMIGAWSRRSLATAISRTSSTSSPTSPRSSASSRFRVAAYRRAAARIRETASSVAELALEGKAKELPDIGKTIEAKIVEVVETGDMEALAKRRAEVPGEVVVVHAAAGARPEDGGADLARARRDDARRAEGGGRGRAAADALRAWAPRPRRRS